MTQPIQPIIDGRFKENKIVRHLLDHGGIDLNKIAMLNFPQEDTEQFAQLIGYSVGGFGSLSYVTDETYDTVTRMALTGETEEQARIKVLREKLAVVRKHLKAFIPTLFKIHPDDLNE